MPAHKKYLLRSPWAKFGKISAAIVGGFFASVFLHLALALWSNLHIVLVTSTFSVFIVWVLLMLMVYWIRSTWRAWGVLSLMIALSSLMIYWGK